MFLPNLGYRSEAGRLLSWSALRERGGEGQTRRVSSLPAHHGDPHAGEPTDIRFIQQQLEHAELSTTQIYTQVSIRMLKKVHTRTHPAKLTQDAQLEEERTAKLAEEEAKLADESAQT